MKKNFMLILCFICASIFSCTSGLENLKPEQNLYILKLKNKAYIFEQNKKEGVFIQFDDPSKIDLENISKINYIKDKFVEITYLNGDLNKLTVNSSNVFGFGKVRGVGFEDLPVGKSLENRNLTTYPVYIDWWNDDSDIQAVKCGCLKNGSKVPNNCKSGGSGSSQCGVTDGGGVMTVNWGNQCETSCSAGHYSCCSAENEFTYDK